MDDEYHEMDELHALSDDEMYFRHVIQDDYELLAMDMMLSNALSQVSD